MSQPISNQLPDVVGSSKFRSSWLRSQLVDAIADRFPGGYQPPHTTGSLPASEPMALAATALLADGRVEEARRACGWLADLQTTDGSVGVMPGQSTPAWPTALAISAWSRFNAEVDASYELEVEQAIAWALQAEGKTIPRKPQIGHDTTLVGWSWAAETHSWLEPTCFFVSALSEAGRRDHPRVEEAVRLLVDRLMPTGGANYGNTRVLGQFLVPHVQPSGIVMQTLAEQNVEDPRIPLTLDYLENSLAEDLATGSLSYAVLGLGSHGRRPALAKSLLNQQIQRAVSGSTSLYKLSLLALADQKLDG